MKLIWTRFRNWIIALLTVVAATFGAVGGGMSYTGAIAGKDSHFYAIHTTSTITSDAGIIAGTSVAAGTAIAAGTSVSAGTIVSGQDLSASRYVTATTGLAIGTTSFTGALKYGYSASVIDGTTIAHGMGTTPTVVILTPYTVSLPLTGTVFVRNTGPISFTVGMTPSQNLALYWLAGK